MLKITPVTQGSTTKLILEGKLVSPWTDELQKTGCRDFDETPEAGDLSSTATGNRDSREGCDPGERACRAFFIDCA